MDLLDRNKRKGVATNLNTLALLPWHIFLQTPSGPRDLGGP